MRYRSLQKFFLWNAIINAIILLASCVFMMALSSWHYELCNQFFSLSKENYNLVIIGFLGLYKLFIFVFNLVPYLALFSMNKARETRELRLTDEEIPLA